MISRIKKLLLLICLSLLIAGFWLVDNLADLLFSFFFAGAVPFTDISIPPTIMLLSYLLLGGLIIVWVIKKELYIGSPAIKESHRKANQLAAKELDRKVAVARRRAIRHQAKLHQPAPAKRRRVSKAISS